MKLPNSAREALVDDIDGYLDAVSEPVPDMLVSFLLGQLEVYADDVGVDDVVSALEESGALESPLAEAMEDEMASNDELELTGEELISLLERMCDVEWVDDEYFAEPDEEEDFDDEP